MSEAKEQAKHLRCCAKTVEDAVGSNPYSQLYRETADMLEQLESDNARLKAERDAAMGDIVHECETCKYGEDSPECAHCYGNPEAFDAFEARWEWRGPQGGGAE